ncbi:iripin-2-like [Brevipalpus obovatus]|uniref:iripin-2-like n=1 Tax=Brevipalpus obovatus TaxID=246614 RepID=UPI003D9E66ED
MFPCILIILLAVFSCYLGDSGFYKKEKITEFTFGRLIGEIRNRPNDNALFSPLSIYICYTLLLAGAGGYTWQLVADDLGLIDDPKHTSPELITSEFSKLSKHYSKDPSMISSNLMAISETVKVEPEYMKTAEQYLAHISKENFGKPQEVQQNINTWVSNKTNNMIPKMLEKAPDKGTLMILLNALYFKGKWKKSFNTNGTRQRKFTNADGSKSSIDFMIRRPNKQDPLSLRYLNDHKKGFQMIELPYKNSMGMFIILPHEGKKLNKILKNKHHLREWMNKIIGLMKSEPVVVDFLGIPKLKLDRKYDMKDLVWVEEIYRDKADFSKISHTKLKVGQSIHKVAIEVNEEGTEAAASTHVEIIAGAMPGGSSGPVRPRFIADRPFAFFIIDKSNWVISFAGAINKL